jgi:hypothetical protein
MFKVEVRKDCKICGGELPKRFRTFCSKECRWKDQAKRYSDYRKEWQQKKRGEYKEGKLQCLFCDMWYVQIGSHTVQKHKMLAREYKIENDLPLNRGVVPEWYKKLKGDQALENGTYHNLLKGLGRRYVKGDPRAKEVTGWKGRTGNIGYTGYGEEV